MNRLLSLNIFLMSLIMSNVVQAQAERMSQFLGINPGLTIEPFYQKGEFDVTIFPLVYQRSVTKIWDLRLGTILNLGIRDAGNRISHFGLEAATPFYFRKKESPTQPSKGLFLAPVISWTRNNIEKHHNLGLFIEPGYHLLFDSNFAFSFGAQFGATLFKYDTGASNWRNHFGVKIIFGKWF